MEIVKQKKKPGPKAGLKKTAEEPIQIYLTFRQKTALQNLCSEKGITLSAFIRQLLIDCGAIDTTD